VHQKEHLHLKSEKKEENEERQVMSKFI